MGVSPMSSMGILPMSTTGILPVGFPSHGRARMALRLMAKMAMLRPELPARLIVVVYLPPAGKGNFFHAGVFRGRAVQAVAPRVCDIGVGVGGGDVQRGLSASRLQFNLYGVPRFRKEHGNGQLVSPSPQTPRPPAEPPAGPRGILTIKTPISE